MHFSFMTRGHIDHVETFIKNLSTRYLKIPLYNKEKNKMENQSIKARLCPIQLWDYVFPEEHLGAVLTTCLSNSEGKPMMKSHNKYIWALRKAMNFKAIPEYKKDQWLNMEYPQNIEIIGIGIKEDFWITEKGKHVDKKNKTPLSYEGI